MRLGTSFVGGEGAPEVRPPRREREPRLACRLPRTPKHGDRPGAPSACRAQPRALPPDDGRGQGSGRRRVERTRSHRRRAAQPCRQRRRPRRSRARARRAPSTRGSAARLRVVDDRCPRRCEREPAAGALAAAANRPCRRRPAALTDRRRDPSRAPSRMRRRAGSPGAGRPRSAAGRAVRASPRTVRRPRRRVCVSSVPRRSGRLPRAAPASRCRTSVPGTCQV